MRRRAEYASAPRGGSGVASSSNHSSTEDADGAAANTSSKRSKEQPSAITPASVIGTIVAVFFIVLIISGNNEWPPKKRRLRQPPFIRGQMMLPSKEEEIAIQRERDNMNLVKMQKQEKEQERQAYERAMQQLAVLLSRDPQDVQVTTDVGGNLGPPSVLNQVVPGKDWLKDRWQAASDMHGTEIKGQHWVELDFTQMREQHAAFWPAYAVLDWETALSTDYVVSGRRRLADEGDAWTVLFDSMKHAYDTTTSGKSPGVKKKMPLHYIHNATLRQEPKLIDAIRIVIRSSDHGWGVSLWQVDIYGWKADETL